MLPFLMLLAVPDPETAIEAERAFNRAAQTEGQWTAFRRFSTEDALMFTPQPAKAHEILPLKDPPITVQWWPADSFVSCDGQVAVNTGPWVRPKAFGYFTTVWVRQGDGHFKWVYDGGDALQTPRALPERPRVRSASCRGKAPPHAWALNSEVRNDGGSSPDGTLTWEWTVFKDGHRIFRVNLWNGKRFDTVLTDDIPAPK
ncbi:hypothetical protein OF829_03780 [Sphingomonas sp. LB-2]|uniref:hypothetical protein n=1 Tax=Sphingomonas caeni TaxID=2984949 RepID=UPI0022321A48|nr:hypothetical protein [Sphingomonas caeni]MCW3846347.1 hypothetical protein [Sphingomonas caeni]